MNRREFLGIIGISCGVGIGAGAGLGYGLKSNIQKTDEDEQEKLMPFISKNYPVLWKSGNTWGIGYGGRIFRQPSNFYPITSSGNPDDLSQESIDKRFIAILKTQIGADLFYFKKLMKQAQLTTHISEENVFDMLKQVT